MTLDHRNRQALRRAVGERKSSPPDPWAAVALLQSTRYWVRGLGIALLGSLAVLLAGSAVRGTSALFEKIPKLVLFPIERVVLEVDWPLEESAVRGWLPSVTGKSLLTVSGGAIVENLLARPWVSEATVRKEFPSNLYVRVRSKRVAALSEQGDKLFLLSEDGRALAEAQPKHFPAVDVPVLRGAGKDDARRSALLLFLEEIRRTVDRNGRLSELVAEDGPWLRAYVSPQRLEVRLSTENLDPELVALDRLLERWPTILEKLKERYCHGGVCPAGYSADVTVPDRLVLVPLFVARTSSPPKPPSIPPSFSQR